MTRVHKHQGSWAFWTEDKKDRIGYYLSKFAAEIGMYFHAKSQPQVYEVLHNDPIMADIVLYKAEEVIDYLMTITNCKTIESMTIRNQKTKKEYTIDEFYYEYWRD